MSLNGLDASDILQAHQDALAEPGGWFLVKYISRDEVALLSRGPGGLGEASIALAAYTDASPLFGFLHYRRRKVLLKYIPADTSRLLLARSGVHFQAFADQFAHEAQFNATAPHDLSDAALAAVCPPHAATSASLHSMASSSKRQNLDEIFEDAEETPRPQIPDEADPIKALDVPEPHIANGVSLEQQSTKDSPTAPDAPLAMQRELPPPLQSFMDEEHTFNIPAYQHDDPPRHSDEWNQSPLLDSRPPTSDSFKYEYDNWQPKEKARPRPIADALLKKVAVAAPVRSMLPAGMRLSTKRADDRPKSSRSQRSLRHAPTADADLVPPLPQSSDAAPSTRATANPMPADSVAELLSPTYGLGFDGQYDEPLPPPANGLETNDSAQADADQVSLGAVKPKPAAITREKQRLLKAMQLRNNKALAKKASAASLKATNDAHAAEDGTNSAHHSSDDPAVPSTENKADVVQPSQEPAAAPGHTIANNGDLPLSKKRRDIASILTSRTMSSDSGFQSDDSLLDELHTAKVQDATPVEVAASPKTPNFPSSGKPAAVTPIHITKSPQSSGMQQASPVNNRSGRVSSMSQTSQEALSLSKNRNVSSGISRRIQALADNSSRDPSPSGQPRVESGPDVARSFLTIRNLASRPSSRGNGQIKGSQASRASSPSRSVASRTMGFFRTQQPIQEERARTSHGTPSVTGSIAESTMTARILQSADGASKKLTQTPVTLGQAEARSASALDRPGSAASISSRQSSRTLLSKQSVENGWNFIKRSGRKAETSRSPPPTQRSMSSTSLERVDEDARVEEKATSSSSRASRLLKRMSGLSTSSRSKDTGSERQGRSSISKDKRGGSVPPAGFSLGDINVQFPDTLLWKRRWVEVDAFGNLVLGAAAGERTRGAKKQFHLREFRPALAPSLERQELPHSIVLDFFTGGTLQLAFEDPIGQTTILKKLLETQSGWAGHE